MPRPVERGQELDGELGRHRRRWRQDGRDAEGRAGEEGKDVDPQFAQADGAGEPFAAGQHYDGVVSAVGDNWHDRYPAAQGEPHGAFPTAEVDLVALGPRAAGLKVPSRVNQDARSAPQCGLGFTSAGWDCAEPAQEGSDAWHGEQEVIGEQVGRRADATA